MARQAGSQGTPLPIKAVGKRVQAVATGLCHCLAVLQASSKQEDEDVLSQVSVKQLRMALQVKLVGANIQLVGYTPLQASEEKLQNERREHLVCNIKYFQSRQLRSAQMDS